MGSEAQKAKPTDSKAGNAKVKGASQAKGAIKGKAKGASQGEAKGASKNGGCSILTHANPNPNPNPRCSILTHFFQTCY